MEKIAGWAPCVHSEEENKEAIKYIEDTIGYATNDGIYGGLLERLLWELSWNGINVQTHADQWWLIKAQNDPNFTDIEISTHIQADTCLLGIVETYKIWKQKFEDVGKEWTR